MATDVFSSRCKLASCWLLLCALWALAPLRSAAWTVTSRELVDVEYGSDESLLILISAPSTTVAGLYRWSPTDPQPTRLCSIASPSFFSFDRKTIIERMRGPTSWLRVYNANNCRLLSRVKVSGLVLDADVRGGNVVASARDAERNHTLQLFSRRGRLLASTPIGRNTEMGFAPDGRSVVNFDLSDMGTRLWTLPKLRPSQLPAWSRVGEITFVPGSPFVKHYVDGKLRVVRWPTGGLLNETTAPPSTRLRQLASNGWLGVLHERASEHDALDWVDLASSRRTTLARGSIDNAALHSSGLRVAWTERGNTPESTDIVQVRQVKLDSHGTVLTGQSAGPSAGPTRH